MRLLSCTSVGVFAHVAFELCVSAQSELNLFPSSLASHRVSGVPRISLPCSLICTGSPGSVLQSQAQSQPSACLQGNYFLANENLQKISLTCPQEPGRDRRVLIGACSFPLPECSLIIEPWAKRQQHGRESSAGQGGNNLINVRF